MDHIGRYKIEGELGRGSMGIALRALDPAIGRTVVIKTIRLAELGDPEERKRLRDRLFHEARSAGTLSHPGIVTVYDVAEEDELAYIAMEFVNGPTLDQLLSSEQPLEPATVFRVLRETAAALDYAHKRGIVHRDIKPANIMIHEDGAVKITDFGVAKIPASQLATQAGTVLGTPSYLSPEQALGKPVDGRSDQFSLAVVAFEMLAGEKPFASDEMAALVYKIAHEEPAPLHALNTSLGWPVEVVLKKALEKGPAARYRTCTEFASALEAACGACRGWAPIPRGHSQNLPTIAVEVPVQQAVGRTPATAPDLLFRHDELPAGQFQETAPTPSETLQLGSGRRKTIVVSVLSALATIAVISLALIWIIGRQTPGPPPAPVKDAPTGGSAAARPSPAGPASSTPASQSPSGTAPEATPAPVTKPEQVPPSPAPARSPARGAVPTAVDLRTSPPGVRVVLDDNPELSCTSPCSVSLPPGRHTAAATLAGYRPALRIFTVPDEDSLLLYLAQMAGEVQVLSEPPGAMIFVDDQRQSQITPATLGLPAGRHVIAVVKDGFRRQEQELDVKDSAFIRVSFTLGR